MNRVLSVVIFVVVSIGAAILLMPEQKQSISYTVASPEEGPLSLNRYCPPGFSQDDEGNCFFESMYANYTSIQGSGLGGLKDGLPEIRDGFNAKVIDLGRFLFFDPILSKDGVMSCATCHDPKKGFSDGIDRSFGVHGEKVARSSPSLWNVGFLDRLFWDARSNSLEEQAEGPLFAADEMGNSPEVLLKDMNANSTYSRLFIEAFEGRDGDMIELDQIVHALTAFQSTLVSFNSRYDQYALGYHEALNKNEIEGLNLFRSFVARCSECHTPPLFTNKQTAVIGTPITQGLPYDVGAEETYKEPTMRGAFKVPTLRNIAKSAPYMHAGQFSKLRDAVEFYNKGRGHAVPKDQTVRVHWHIWEPNLKQNEIDRLVDFLGTLTDESFMPKTPVQVPSGLAMVSSDEFQSKMMNKQTGKPQIAQSVVTTGKR
ncbi:cytochrome c peroxidase [Temperatibacter marinus]|uniref:Cytochrome c peroxidase n=1 Tax=Temperatibacter marinus TaxID=1456591 RepID=A0AA52H8V4_9PROT|nr:cytochrome c peroxidase [Temperatibacter marinus]WND02511.1 cytochrome c peroxidase [Temperatibacter marinus]